VSERASLDSLRKMIGAQATKDDGTLSICLEAAGNWVYDRVYPTMINDPEVVQAVLLLASRLYKRRLSPEGVAGWDDMGAIRIIARDPDLVSLLEQKIHTYRVLGIA